MCKYIQNVTHISTVKVLEKIKISLSKVSNVQCFFNPIRALSTYKYIQMQMFSNKKNTAYVYYITQTYNCIRCK